MNGSWEIQAPACKPPLASKSRERFTGMSGVLPVLGLGLTNDELVPFFAAAACVSGPVKNMMLFLCELALFEHCFIGCVCCCLTRCEDCCVPICIRFAIIFRYLKVFLIDVDVVLELCLLLGFVHG